MEPILKIEDLSVSYGAIKALQNVNITVNRGGVVAILGSNGAGKSTLLKTISGLVPQESGKIIFNDQDISETSVERITDLGISHTPEGRQIFADLSVYENLKIGAFTVKETQITPDKVYDEVKKRPRIQKLLKSLSDDTETITLTKEETIANNFARVYDLFPVLLERKKQIASTLSGGEMQMLAIGRALMGSPDLLIMDEPSLGLAPMIVQNIFKIIKELNEMGITVLIVEQNALQTLKIADYAYVLKVGKVVNEGKAQALLNDQSLIDAYLGK